MASCRSLVPAGNWNCLDSNLETLREINPVCFFPNYGIRSGSITKYVYCSCTIICGIPNVFHCWYKMLSPTTNVRSFIYYFYYVVCALIASGQSSRFLCAPPTTLRALPQPPREQNLGWQNVGDCWSIRPFHLFNRFSF